MVYRIFTCSLLLSAAAVYAAHPLGRRLQIRNEGAVAVEIEWVNPITGEIVPFAGSQQGEVLSFNSYVNHTFRFRPSTLQESEVQFVTVGQEDEEQIFVLKEDFEVVRLNANSIRQLEGDVGAVTDMCRQRALEQLTAAEMQDVDVQAVSQDLIKCLEREAARLFEIRNEELAFQRQLRRDIANLGENYTCADPTKETTTKARYEVDVREPKSHDRHSPFSSRFKNSHSARFYYPRRMRRHSRGRFVHSAPRNRRRRQGRF